MSYARIAANPPGAWICGLVVLVWGLSTGCGLVERGPGAAEVLAEVRASADRDPKGCFERIKALRAELDNATPEEQGQAFMLASGCFQKAMKSARMAARMVDDHRGSRWLNAERDFMYDWLGRRFAGDESPAAWAQAFFAGFPYDVYEDFKVYQARRPELGDWTLYATWDNGVIQEVRVVPAGTEPERGFKEIWQPRRGPKRSLEELARAGEPSQGG